MMFHLLCRLLQTCIMNITVYFLLVEPFLWVSRWGTADAEIKPTPSLVGAQGYQRLPLYKPVVGQRIAVHAVPVYGASTYLHKKNRKQR